MNLEAFDINILTGIYDKVSGITFGSYNHFKIIWLSQNPETKPDILVELGGKLINPLRYN